MPPKKSGKKCPNCSKRYPATRAGHTAFMKHWYKQHYKPKKKAKAKSTWGKPRRK